MWSDTVYNNNNKSTHSAFHLSGTKGFEGLLLLRLVFKVDEAEALGETSDRATLAGDDVGVLDLVAFKEGLEAVANFDRVRMIVGDRTMSKLKRKKLTCRLRRASW